VARTDGKNTPPIERREAWNVTMISSGAVLYRTAVSNRPCGIERHSVLSTQCSIETVQNGTAVPSSERLRALLVEETRALAIRERLPVGDDGRCNQGSKSLAATDRS
jgi:hypothetical protein